MLSHVIEDTLWQSREQRDTASKCFREVDLTGHREFGDGRDFARAAALDGEKVDDFVLQQCRVGVHHHQVLGATVQSGALHREVQAARARDRDQLFTKEVVISAANDELVTVNWIARQVHDALTRGVRAGDGREDVFKLRRANS